MSFSKPPVSPSPPVGGLIWLGLGLWVPSILSGCLNTHVPSFLSQPTLGIQAVGGEKGKETSVLDALKSVSLYQPSLVIAKESWCLLFCFFKKTDSFLSPHIGFAIPISESPTVLYFLCLR